MNILLLIYDGYKQEELDECVTTFINKSAGKHEIWLYSRTKFHLPVKHLKLGDRWDNRRMTNRMEIVRDLPVREGDCIISCDIDVKFQNDPFAVFENNFDLFYTSREYECDSTVNAGVWGIRKTTDSYDLLNFMINEAECPSWPPYLFIRTRLNRNNRAKEIDWWSNQDLLCAIHEYGSPIGITFDAGSPYNCCPETGPNIPITDEKIIEFKSKFDNPNYIIMHYKELKGKL